MRKDQIECDTCGKVQLLGELINWYRVNVIGTNVSAFQDLPQEGDVCSYQCLAIWASARAMQHEVH